MAYVITNLCKQICSMECSDVCPNHAIKLVKADRNKRLYIKKYECDECGECEMVCPSKAIFHENDVPINKHIKVHQEDLDDEQD